MRSTSKNSAKSYKITPTFINVIDHDFKINILLSSFYQFIL